MRATLERTMKRKDADANPPFRRPRVRKCARPAPQMCPIHGIPMVVRRTTAAVRYHYCSHPDCKESKVTSR